VLFRERFVGLFSDLGDGLKEPAIALEPGVFGVAGILKLALASLPALLIGFIFRHPIKAHLFSPLPVAVALAVGALLILLVERSDVSKHEREVEQLTWRQSVLIGLVQCLALWPGMSRSASTIIGGMLVGLSRRAAAEFSFLAAVPVLTVAALHDMVEVVRVFSFEDLKLVAIGFMVSFITALFTMRWFMRLISVWTLRPFAYYRLAVAALVLLLL
jgi:undecaprenyl-diphosphatase